MSEDVKVTVLKYLKEQFGVDRIDFELKKGGKGKVYAFRKCNFDPGDIEGIDTYHGIYLGRIEKDGFRLSIEGSFIIGPLATKNVVEIGDATAMQWMKGNGISSNVKGYVILKWRNFFVGCGKGNGKVIKNFVPGDRRITAKY